MIYNPILKDTVWSYEYPVGSGTFIDVNTLISNLNSSDVVNLPKDTLKTQIIVTKDCFIVGQGTNALKSTIDLSDIDQSTSAIKAAIVVKNCTAHISNINIFNKLDVNHYGIWVESATANLDNVLIDGVVSENLSVQNYLTGIVFTKCISSSLDTVTVSDCKIGIQFNDSYGLYLSSCDFFDNETSLDFEGSSSTIGDLGTPVVVMNKRTDRTHDITVESSSIYKCTYGVQLRNSNHISFSACKIYDVDIGIQQWPNSHNNKFRGEIFQTKSYGIKVLDTIVSTTDVHYFDALETWWGNSLGPDNLVRNIDSTKLSKGILFEPWSRTGTEPPQSYPGTRRWIWSMLGYPQVRVELTEEDITDCIRMSLDKYLYYATPDLDYYYFEGPTNNIQEYELPPEIPHSAITEVIYQPNSDIFTNLSGSGESFFLTYYMQRSGGTFLADFYIAMSYKETLERTLGIAPSYEFLSRIVNGQVKEYIRVYPKSENCLRLGIKYNRMITEYETDGTTWVRKYALAWAKEKLGRVRSKFPSVPGPTGELQLDGGTLLQESATEKEALINEIISLGEPLSFTTG